MLEVPKMVTCLDPECGYRINVDFAPELMKHKIVDFKCPNCGKTHWFYTKTGELVEPPGWFFTALCIFYLVAVLAGIGVIIWLLYQISTCR